MQYDLSVAWDVSTAVNNGVELKIDPPLSENDDIATNMAWKTDSGLRMFICVQSNTTDIVYQYDL